MSTSRTHRTITALLAAATVGAMGLAWRERTEKLELGAKLAANDSADLKRRLNEAQQHEQALADELAVLRGKVQKQTAQAGTAGNPRPPGAKPGSPMEAANDLINAFQKAMGNPQFQKLMAVQQRVGLDAQYGALFKQLNLTADQLNQLKELLVQRQQAMVDAWQAAQTEGITPNGDPQGFHTAVLQAETSVDAQIQSILGDAGYGQFQQYQQTLPQRTTVNQFQQSLKDSANPLTDDQASQLMNVLVQNASQQPNGTNGQPFGMRTPITNQVLAQAQEFLSPPQVQALRDVQQQQAIGARMIQILGQQAGGQGATSGN